MHAPLPLLSHICTQTTPHPPAPLGLWPPPLRPNLPSEPQLDQDYGKDFSLSGRAHLLPQWKTEGKQRPGTRNSYLLSFICVYRGWGSGSWSLTSKLAPGSWKGHGEFRDGCLPPQPPHIIACQVRVVLLDAIVQNGDHDATPRVALGPGLLHVQVPLGDTRLQRHPPPSLSTYEMWLLGEVTGTLENPFATPKSSFSTRPCSSNATTGCLGSWNYKELWEGTPQGSAGWAGVRLLSRQRKTDRRPRSRPHPLTGPLSGWMDAAREATYQVPLLGKLGVRGLLVHVPFGPSLCHLLLQPLYL